MVLHVEIGQPEALTSEVIDIRGRYGAALHSDVAPTPVVDKDVDDIGAFLRGARVGGRKRGRRKDQGQGQTKTNRSPEEAAERQCPG